MESKIRSIFKRGSRTYFTSSLFFPETVRRDVFQLYAFVRSADDFVDALPQRRTEFYRFWEEYRDCLTGNRTIDPIICPFVAMAQRTGISPEWIESFLLSMEMDLYKTHYRTLDEVLIYSYGAAEVIGLMMSAILRLPAAARPQAMMLGRSMQYINFIRDIAEDLTLGRIYLPGEDLEMAGLASLDHVEVERKPEAFARFMNQQTARFKEWQQEAESGFHYLPKRVRIPVKTASDMYLWTARQIEKEPMLVYRRKVKPGRSRIILDLLRNWAAIYRPTVR